MTRLLAVCLTSCLATVCSPAIACDKESTETLNSTCVEVVRGGRTGAWFDLSTATQLGIEHSQIPIYAGMVDKCQALVALQEEQLTASERANARLIEAAKAYDLALKDARESAASAAAWYRSPVTWGLVGVGLGAATSIYLLSSLR
jgi:hypothetical protein